MTIAGGVAIALGIISAVQAVPMGRSKTISTIDFLQGYSKRTPTWPPGLRGTGAIKRVILDVGANNGDHYTLQGYLAGHTVVSFEASPVVQTKFKALMKANDVQTTVVHVQSPENSLEASASSQLEISIARTQKQPHVYLVPVALSNTTGHASFHESPCQNKNKCGKANHLTTGGLAKGKTTVPVYRLDDIRLPVDKKRVWLLKIDVEGFENEVLHGARNLLTTNRIPYISVEFSPNGRKGTQWGENLLETLHGYGYSCHHMRGFGRCFDASARSPSIRCNFPFDTELLANAPSFKEYTKVFEIHDGEENKSQAMADLICSHKSIPH